MTSRAHLNCTLLLYPPFLPRPQPPLGFIFSHLDSIQKSNKRKWDIKIARLLVGKPLRRWRSIERKTKLISPNDLPKKFRDPVVKVSLFCIVRKMVICCLLIYVLYPLELNLQLFMLAEDSSEIQAIRFFLF